jgi:creatinine amidohydrolase
VLVVPIGSLEQHGPHLPLDTDTRIATALAAELAQRRRGVVIGPPVPYGSSGEHAEFPGTLSIGLAPLAAFLSELIRSARPSFAGTLVVSAHGGNAEALGAVRELSRSEGDPTLIWEATVPGGDGHAGRTETSLMLYIDPKAVHLGAAEAGRVEPLPELMPELRRRGVRAVSPNGVLGDPRGASAGEGRTLIEAMSSRLAEALDAWRETTG